MRSERRLARRRKRSWGLSSKIRVSLLGGLMIALAWAVFWEVRHDKNDLVPSTPVATKAPPSNAVGKPGARYYPLTLARISYKANASTFRAERADIAKWIGIEPIFVFGFPGKLSQRRECAGSSNSRRCCTWKHNAACNCQESAPTCVSGSALDSSTAVKPAIGQPASC